MKYLHSLFQLSSVQRLSVQYGQVPSVGFPSRERSWCGSHTSVTLAQSPHL